MENATKALMIAAAVLVAIIIITLGLTIVRQGQEAVTGADLSEAEATEFNSKFTGYEGSNVSTAQVNALLNTVFSHNKNELESGDERFVSVTVTSNASASIGDTTSAQVASRTTVPRVTGSGYYTVTCNYNGRIINLITVTPR